MKNKENKLEDVKKKEIENIDDLNLRDEVKKEEPKKEENKKEENKKEENDVSFKGKGKIGLVEKLGKIIDKNKSDFVSSELEYNGKNFTNTLMAGLSLFGLLTPRGLRAYNRAEKKEDGKKITITEDDIIYTFVKSKDPKLFVLDNSAYKGDSIKYYYTNEKDTPIDAKRNYVKIDYIACKYKEDMIPHVKIKFSYKNNGLLQVQPASP